MTCRETRNGLSWLSPFFLLLFFHQISVLVFFGTFSSVSCWAQARRVTVSTRLNYFPCCIIIYQKKRKVTALARLPCFGSMKTSPDIFNHSTCINSYPVLSSNLRSAMMFLSTCSTLSRIRHVFGNGRENKKSAFINTAL